jgi:translocation and assembly module TamB
MLPAELLKADGFESFTVRLSGEWKTNQFNASVDLHAQPTEGAAKKRPAFNLSVAAHGNLKEATLDRARIYADWLDANLERPVTFDYKGNLEAVDVPFRMKADLNQQSWLPVRGFLEGVVRLNPGTIREPNLRFRLGGQQIKGYGLDEATLNMNGQIRWPLMTIAEGSFSQTNGATGTFKGQINLETREVSPSHFAFRGKVGEPFLPKGFDYQAAEVTADVSGFWPKLHHSGTIAVSNLTYNALTNATLGANWRGIFPDIDLLELSVQSTTNHLQFSGALHLLPTVTNVTIQALTWWGGEKLMLGTGAPFEIELRKNTNESNGFPEMRVKNLKISGQGTEIAMDAEVAWPEQGQLQISATNLNSRIAASLAGRPVPEIHLPRFILTAAWDHGPLQMELSLLYNAVIRGIGPVNSSVDFQSDKTGLSVNALNISDASGAIVRAEGTLPVRIYPGGEAGKHFQISGSREVNFHATSAPNATFWEAVGKWTGFYIRDPVLKVDISGKTKEPVGRLSLTATEIHTTRITKKIPHLENIRIFGTLDERALSLDSFDFSIEQQFLQTSAKVPLAENLWRRTHGQIFEYLTTNATANLHGANIQIAPFSRYIPAMLAPEGEASVNLTILPPLQLNGEIKVQNVSTRPIEAIGPVQEIAASIQLSNRTVRIKNFSGELGGESLSVNGTVDWSEPLLATGFPGLDLRITGKSIPLARRPELILRSDVNLTVNHTRKSGPTIAGEVNLKNSFFLSDLKFLVPGRLAKPRNRPPYFSVELDPFASWALDLRVRGDRFMKVRSPFFQGEVSSDFKVTGTLREPLALGDARINSGFIQFPFANLEVKQGLVTLASENPYLPTVFVTAGARAFGYELKMQVNGPADVPAIEFSSTPPLTSEEIVLMLTAGQLPRHELTFSTQQKAGTLALFLGKSLWAKFGSDEPGAERLTVRSGEDISDQGRQTYAVEYRLSKNWSLVGEYDRFSALNAGFKWRLYSR